jgi:RNA recognition motif. (a.k.a. RRM, RBD, or RNP domain)
MTTTSPITPLTLAELMRKSYFEILNIDPNSERSASLIQRVDNFFHRYSIENHVDFNPDAAPVDFNIYLDAVTMVKYEALWNEYKVYYDHKMRMVTTATNAANQLSPLTRKLGDIRANLRSFTANYNEQINRVRNCRAHVLSIVDNLVAANAVARIMPQNTLLNRIRVWWKVQPGDTSNANVTKQTLLEAFRGYGRIIASVVCSDRVGCGIVEFAQNSSAQQAVDAPPNRFKATWLPDTTMFPEEHFHSRYDTTHFNNLRVKAQTLIQKYTRASEAAISVT